MLGAAGTGASGDIFNPVASFTVVGIDFLVRTIVGGIDVGDGWGGIVIGSVRVGIVGGAWR